jgi:hypothetical protein
MRFTESLVATSGPTKNAQKLLTAYVHFEQLTIQLRGYLRVTCNSGEGEYQAIRRASVAAGSTVQPGRAAATSD